VKEASTNEASKQSRPKEPIGHKKKWW
jgi:hypothetical protein